MRNFARLDAFLAQLVGDIYPEPPMEPHLTLTRQVIDALVQTQRLKAGDKVLDIGCGQGLALERFQAHGLSVTGVTLGPDAETCRAKGFTVIDADQSFLDLPDDSFDLLWCRHVLEHSIAPYFTLSEYRRLTRPGGLIYVEVPAPDTACHHEANPNHYSVHTRSTWLQLFHRSKLEVIETRDIKFTVPAGPDLYWSFLLRRRP